jgi:hypothetical protein
MAACIAMKCPNSLSPRLWWIGRCRACVASAGCADDVQHRHVLGVAAGDRVDGAELADAEGRAERGDPAQPP